ncbi:serine hydrolase [Chryseobacterium shigense]|uniref:CubicO group peptidase (Beta-lactamase class C family) n=1 Tax=Chryseobacterium shigense TaxID=297244 RepID=A0A841NC87_9FLAO|nr:serine hydrolase [Chryseobacterium shigense]MBB6372291.1 CubicO group peptidase (beta-lactamase class C family) [Chryseobacterium shigense]
MTRIHFLLLIIFLFLSQKAEAQTDKPDALYKTILAKDSLLFDVGFNTCNIKQYENLLSENLKFYHDKDGISSKTKFLNDLKNGLCKNPETRQVKRVLMKNSTEVFPLYKNGNLYGAVQNGTHMFYENPSSEPGVAKFSNVWELENGEWKLTTSLSFNHQAYSSPQNGNSVLDDDAAIESWLKENHIKTLGLGIIEEGKLKQVKVFGEIKNGVSAPYNTIFNVASLTKPITAMVALKLVSSGKWSLDEPVYKYWTDPDLINDPRNRKLTTRLILSHQTGLPNWRWQTENNKLQFEFDPGTKYQYSGEGFEYLRKALENKFKKPLEQLAAELVFHALKMNNTDFIWDKNTDESRFAIGYDKDGKPYETVKNKTANAADDLHTTIEDYGNFLVNILNGGGLTENVYQEMLKSQVKTKENKYFGLGFELYDLGKGNLAVSHGGSDFGTQCITFLLPKTKQGILIFTNSDAGYKIYDKLLIHYLGENGKKLIDIETN